mmetsp:Transcript_11580/g.43223  ORF Transcript_11580/g.43223 Transcript_11580/m.43223 type:complete len:205 (-) Transcript_11580:118-732(-)
METPSERQNASRPPEVRTILDESVKERIRRNREAALKKLAERKRKKDTIDLTEGPDDAKRPRVQETEPILQTPQAEWTADQLCDACGKGGEIDEEYRSAFKVQVCNSCRYGNPEYEVISKGTAQTEFLLPPSTLHVLRYLEKQNPRHSGFSNMKLYLRAQVREKAMARWGSEEAIEAERRRREREKFERSRQKATRILKGARKR